MQITLWSNIESFPPGRQADLAWAKAYGESLKQFGHEVSYGHPLLPHSLKSDLIHIFGAGRWETLPALAKRAKSIWLSPAGLTGSGNPTRQPENTLKHLARLPWRMIRQKKIYVECEKTWLDSVSIYVWPESGRPAGWPGGNHRIFPVDPLAAASQANEWLKAEVGIAKK